MKKVCEKHFEENCTICHPNKGMKKLNDLYVSVDKWYKKQDPDFVG